MESMAMQKMKNGNKIGEKRGTNREWLVLGPVLRVQGAFPYMESVAMQK
jgi:hypothetical protein